MKIAIVGSQKYKHIQRVIDYVQSLPLDTVIVSGGAVGPDKTAEEAANQRGMPEPLIFLPEWEKYGKPAGPIRNKLIVQEADKVVAFWDGRSPGTRSSIDFARERGIPVEIVLDESEKCVVCGLHDGTVKSPSGVWYCERHGRCPHCGGCVSAFVPYTIKGTVKVETYICSCVVRHGIKVHNEVIASRARRADEEAKANKKKRKVS